MSRDTVLQACDLLFPYLENEAYVNFYGGEPLLELPLMQYAIALFERKSRESGKNIRYSMTTNGSLLTPEIAAYLDHHRFSLMLSFDGLAQEARQPKSLREISAIGQMLQRYPGIELKTNSVFGPETIDLLADSVRFLLERGFFRQMLSLNTLTPWGDADLERLAEQFHRIKEILLTHYRQYKSIPIPEFAAPPRQGLFRCDACTRRIAVAPNGDMWGCFRFPDFFIDKQDTREYRKFFIGELEKVAHRFDESWDTAARHYKTLNQAMFFTDETFCSQCPDLLHCHVCPVSAATGHSLIIGGIPTWQCRITRIKNQFLHQLHRELPSRN